MRPKNLYGAEYFYFFCDSGQVVARESQNHLYIKKNTVKMSLPIYISAGISILAYISTRQLIPGLKNMFLAANLAGIDMNKKTKTKM
jgi:hypothetical protein